MAVRLTAVGTSQLNLASVVTKPDFTAARTIAGTSGLVMGFWKARWVRWPAGATLNTRYFLDGWDGAGALNSSGLDVTECHAVIGADVSGSQTFTGALRLRPRINYVGANTSHTPLNTGSPGDSDFTGLPQVPAGSGTAFLLVEGLVNIGSTGSPNWRFFAALCPFGGSVSSAVRTLGTNGATWLANTTGALLGQIFSRHGTNARTPAGVVMEHLALVQGDFPWDTVNNRPHHDAIAALAGVGGNPFLDYDDLVAAQNAGTLPYSNCDQGRGDITHWWRLENMSALGHIGSAAANAFAEDGTAGSIVDETSIAPAHWTGTPATPGITPPRLTFFGGAGTRNVTIAGTWTGNVERRWEVQATGVAVPGFDWAVRTTTAGAWSTSDVLPVGGPYRLRVRSQADPLVTASPLEDILVGTRVLCHGQSGVERSFQGSGQQPMGLNNLGIAVASGAQGMVVKMTSQYGGTAGTYAQPGMATGRMRSGETPAIGHGAINMLNQWHAVRPNHPLCIINMAIEGTAMSAWASNAAVEGGHPSWVYMGAVQPPGVTAGDGSGVVGFYAWLLEQHIDAHLIMWHPNMSSDAAVRASYRSEIDARFVNAASAPWLVLPPWRGHRPNTGADGIITRNSHILFAAELGARGFLGPQWSDVISDSSNGLHSAFNSAPGVPSATFPVSDGNQVGQARIGRGLGRALARVFDQTINAQFRMLGAWWTDDGNRNQINIELGRPARTLNGASVRADVCWVSEDNGATFVNTGFTAALDATATRLVLTKDSGTWAGTVRVDYGRDWPNPPAQTADEATVEPLLDGLIYDSAAWRGRTNLASPAGNVLQGTNRVLGAGVAGVAVTARGARKLVTFERMAGSRSVTVEMRALGTGALLASKPLAITAS